MILYPAIDLMNGRCVRLRQGRFEDATVYAPYPVDALQAFADAGAEWAHIVDLDGARDGQPRQHELLRILARTAKLKLQVAGGVRMGDDVIRLLDAGASRVVFGSLAVERPHEANLILKNVGSDRITFAFDIRLSGDTPIVSTRGWQESSGRTLLEVAKDFPQARHMLVTDISRDGMMNGPNTALVRETAQRLPRVAIQASGGVSSLSDLTELKAAGAAGAIVGKALWERSFSLEEAVVSARA